MQKMWQKYKSQDFTKIQATMCCEITKWKMSQKYKIKNVTKIQNENFYKNTNWKLNFNLSVPTTELLWVS